MPDLEQRIRDGLDRLSERPDPDRIVERVGSRKRHLRFMHRVQTVTLVIAVLAGVAGGMYGLTRVFGVVAPRHVPGSSPNLAPPTSSPSPAIALCSGRKTAVTMATQEGAAG